MGGGAGEAGHVLVANEFSDIINLLNQANSVSAPGSGGAPGPEPPPPTGAPPPGMAAPPPPPPLPPPPVVAPPTGPSLTAQVADALSQLARNTSDVIGGIFKDVGGAVNEVITAVDQNTANQTSQIATNIQNLVSNGYYTLSSVVDSLAQKTGQELTFATDNLHQTIDKISVLHDTIQGAINNVQTDIANNVGSLLGLVKDTSSGLIGLIQGGVTDALNGAAQKIKDIETGTGALVKSLADDISSGFVQFAAADAPWLQSLAEKVGSAFWAALFQVDIDQSVVDALLAGIRSVSGGSAQS